MTARITSQGTNVKNVSGTVTAKVTKSVTLNGDECKMTVGGERDDNIVLVHQNQRKSKVQKEKEGTNGSPLGKTSDGRRVREIFLTFFFYILSCKEEKMKTHKARSSAS